MVEAVDLERTYRLGGPDGAEVAALRGVSLTVAPGDFVAVLGPSGSGKSTLLHLLGALDRPTAGTLRLAGRDVATMSDAELAALRNRDIGFVFQQFHLLARTTALANVALPLVYRGVARRDRLRAAREALEAVGLGHRLDHRPSQLSGGEQQRVAIARALVGRPRLLLADEPTGNLDTATGADIIALLRRRNADDGVAVVVITHDPEIAGHAARQVRLRDGRLAEDDDAPAASSWQPGR